MYGRARSIRINWTEAELPADPRVSLLDLNRERLHLHGTKRLQSGRVGCPAMSPRTFAPK